MSSAFDIPGRKFDFKADLEFGQQSEKEISSFLDDLSDGAFEVKTDRYRNGRMIVETDQNPRGVLNQDGEPIWHKSGINVTTAKWWVYVFSPGQGFVMIDVGRLKRYLRANKEKFNESTKISLGGADNPARGFLLMADDVKDLLINELYD
jgi:hypothetical protein